MLFKLYEDDIIAYKNETKVFLFDIYYFILICGIETLLNLTN